MCCIMLRGNDYKARLLTLGNIRAVLWRIRWVLWRMIFTLCWISLVLLGNTISSVEGVEGYHQYGRGCAELRGITPVPAVDPDRCNAYSCNSLISVLYSFSYKAKQFKGKMINRNWSYFPSPNRISFTRLDYISPQLWISSTVVLDFIHHRTACWPIVRCLVW